MNLLLFKSYSLKGLAVVVVVVDEAIADVAFAGDRALRFSLVVVHPLVHHVLLFV